MGAALHSEYYTTLVLHRRAITAERKPAVWEVLVDRWTAANPSVGVWEITREACLITTETTSVGDSACSAKWEILRNLLAQVG